MRRAPQLPGTVPGNLGKPTQLELRGHDSGRGNTRDLGKHVGLGKHSKAGETLAIGGNTRDLEVSGEGRRAVHIPKLGKPLPKIGETPLIILSRTG